MKRAVAREQEIERGPQAVNVGPGVGGVAVRGLLRGDVIGGSERAPQTGHAEVVGLLAEETGQAHVENFDHARPVEHQVGRLDVAVDQPGLVGVLQSQGGLADVVGGAEGVHRPSLLDDPVQGAAVDVLHDQEMHPAVPVHVIAADDVGVAELGDGPGLAVEAFQGRGLPDPRGGEHLDGHAVAHDPVLAQVDLAHAPGAQRPEDDVLAVEDEVPPPSQQEVFGLEARQEAVSHQGVGQGAGDRRHGAAVRLALKEIRLEASRINQAALTQ